jgi:glycine dehydrogenase subunit 1
MFKYLPHTPAEIKEMLKVIGVNSIDDLFHDVPKSLKELDLDIPCHKSELEIHQYFDGLARKNKPLIPFVGAGAYDHYTPSVIRHLIERQEFLTAYTPYQPEISQGTLQYIFEYQSIVAELTKMYVSNASMYDGATATAEAMMMATKTKKRDKILVSKTVHPATLNVLKTYAKTRSVDMILINEKDGITDVKHFTDLNDKTVAGVIVQSPNVYGNIEPLNHYRTQLDLTKGLFIVNSDLASQSILKPAGEYGADIVVGDAQSMGIPLWYGGPYIGYMATTKKLMRKMPGRICGLTHDVDGKRAFVLTLQAREQHIRREKANSNICSNQSLLALFVTIYAAIMGKKGLIDVQQKSYNATHYLAERLTALDGFDYAFDQPFFKDVCLTTTKDPEELQSILEEVGLFGPLIVPLESGQKGLLFSATEKRTKAEIDQLIHALEVR